MGTPRASRPGRARTGRARPSACFGSPLTCTVEQVFAAESSVLFRAEAEDTEHLPRSARLMPPKTCVRRGRCLVRSACAAK